MSNYDFKDIRQRAKGNWFEILTSNGIDARFLKNKNGPCPMCNGKDRWRWDNKNGDGGGYCHQCDLKGSGFTILGKWLDLTAREDFPKLLKILSESLNYSSKGINQKSSLDANSLRKFLRSTAMRIWNESTPLTIDDIATTYLAGRGLKFPAKVESLRIHPMLEYRNGKAVIGKFPALIGKVTDSEGNFAAIHRTYLDLSGKKVQGLEAKLMLGPISGGAIHLDVAGETLNVAEGIETALAVREFTGAPTWSAMTAGNLEKIEIPDFVKKVVIWADKDLNQRGELAAHCLARRLYYQKIETIIKVPEPLPDFPKLDWLDVHARNSGSNL